MDRPPPDPAKLLDEWMEWERGETTPGRVMANLKTGGLRDLLEALVATGTAGSGDEGGAGSAGTDVVAEAAWEPSV